MYPVVAATRPPDGLGYTSSQIATTLLLTSPVLLIVQLVGYPILSTRFSYTALWGSSSVMFLLVYLAYPFALLLPTGSWLQWSCICGLLGIRISAVVIGYTSLAVLVRALQACAGFSTFASLTITTAGTGRATRCERSHRIHRTSCCISKPGNRPCARGRPVVLGPHQPPRRPTGSNDSSKCGKMPDSSCQQLDAHISLLSLCSCALYQRYRS
jgi:hypothetical protein